MEVAFEPPAGTWDGAAAADFGLGLRLRGYRFDKYKTRKKEIGRGERRPAGVRHRLEPCGGGPLGLARANGRGRRRRDRPRPRQRAAERALSRRIRRSRQGAGDPRSRGERPRREGDGKAGHERPARRRPRVRARQPPRHHALERRPREARQANRRGRQGRLLRLGRNLDQALRRDGGHEGRHGRRRLRGRPHACAGDAQVQGQRGRRGRTRRKHARRGRHPPGRRSHLDVRTDDRDRQHRRRGPPRSRRRALVRAGDLFAAPR